MFWLIALKINSKLSAVIFAFVILKHIHMKCLRVINNMVSNECVSCDVIVFESFSLITERRINFNKFSFQLQNSMTDVSVTVYVRRTGEWKTAETAVLFIFHNHQSYPRFLTLFVEWSWFLALIAWIRSNNEGNYKTSTPGPWTPSVDPVHGPGLSKYGLGPWTGLWTASMDPVHGPDPRSGSMDQGCMFCTFPQ